MPLNIRQANSLSIFKSSLKRHFFSACLLAQFEVLVFYYSFIVFIAFLLFSLLFIIHCFGLYASLTNTVVVFFLNCFINKVEVVVKIQCGHGLQPM